MTINEVQDQIIAEMTELGDWFDKYEHLICLGRGLAPMDASMKISKNQIDGCQSRVWITAHADGSQLHLMVDSDSQITRGIISLLLRVLDQRAPAEVVGADLYFIEKIGLSTNLSPSRANGLALIIRQMKSLAQSHC